jgi:hypothetical protein
MSTEILPSAEGDLGRTPFAHLLVYAIDRQLTGALFLREPSGLEHGVRLEAGVAVKIHPGDGHARLGELLVACGAIDEPTLEGALSMPGLLGDALLLAGCVERDTLERVAEQQFVIRMVRLFGLPPETTYRYFDARTDLVDDAAPPSQVHPLAVLWAGMREHAPVSAMMEATLERLGDTPIRLHPNAPLERFAPTPPEWSILERIRRQEQPLSTLLEAGIGPEETLLWMVYALVITRNLDLGLPAQPLFAEPTATKPATAPVALARIRLRHASHRVGAAAPDTAGEGERVRVQPRPKKRGKPSSYTLAAARRIETPPPMERTTIEPQSSVIETRAATEAEAVSDEHVGTELDLGSETSAEASSVEAVETVEAVEAAEPPPSQPPGVPLPPEGRPDAALPANALYRLATSRLVDRDLQGALAACQLAREIDPTQADYAALAVWIRSMLGGADLTARVAELDALLEACGDHVQALFYRGFLRRRIGDEAGAERDLRRVLSLEPSHLDAARELRRLEMRQPAKRPSGLFKR